MTFRIGRVPVRGRRSSLPPTKSFIGSFGSNTNLTTYDLLLNTGSIAEADDRYIVFGAAGGAATGNNSAIVRIAVNGVAATKLVEIVPALIIMGSIWIVHMPMGNVLQFNAVFGETQNAVGFAAWAAYGISPVAADTDSASATGTSISITGLTVPTNGLGFAAAFIANSNTMTWGGVTEEYDAAQTGRSSGGSTTTAGTNTIDCTFANSNGTLCGAAFSASGV